MRQRVLYRPAALEALGRRVAGEAKLEAVFRALRRRFPSVERLAVAVYDERRGTLSTFLARETRPSGLWLYEAALTRSPTLRRLARTGELRVVGDMRVFSRSRRRHARALAGAGYRSSLTVPILAGRRPEAFVFLNSRRAHAFPDSDLAELEAFCRLAAEAALEGPRAARLLRAALREAVSLVHARDPETGAHVERMARYCRIISLELARSGRRPLTDVQTRTIEDLAPLHDVGKIAVPDRVLMKRGPLTGAERNVMRSHTTRGRMIVDAILRRFAAGSPALAHALREIAEHHHEALDGSGYPDGLRGAAVSTEARVVAVADVFDALTSRRCYKRPWSTERAFAELRAMAPSKLDPDCVEALIARRRAVEAARRRLADGAGA